ARARRAGGGRDRRAAPPTTGGQVRRRRGAAMVLPPPLLSPPFAALRRPRAIALSLHRIFAAPSPGLASALRAPFLLLPLGRGESPLRPSCDRESACRAPA